MILLGYQKQMKLNQLRDFLAVAQHGGIRAAARELGLTQPSISKSIQQLEASLGVPLFDRTGRKLRLNRFGEAFLARTSGVVNQLRRAEDEIEQLRTESAGAVSLSMGGVSLLTLLPGALLRFRKRFTDASIRLVERTYEQAITDLRSGEIEFAVLPEPPEAIGSEFAMEILLRDRYVVVGRRGHPLAALRDLEGLLQASWIVTRQRGVRTAEFEQMFKRRGLPVPRVEIHCESLIAVLALLARTDLLAILPSRWLRVEPVGHVAQALPVDDLPNANSICVLWRAANPLTPAAAAFVAALTVEANAQGSESR